MAPPGILYVKMAPQPSLPATQFHDWYNNDHGPTRLRLPFVQNGFRYRATDLDTTGKGEAEYMAIYDISDMSTMLCDEYTRLRKPPAQHQRERDTMKQIKVDRRFFDLVEEQKSPNWVKMEDVEREGESQVLVAVSLSFKKGKEDDIRKWYSEEHIPMLAKVPGWRRSRQFVTSTVEPKEETEYLTIHEYAPENGLDGPEFKAATDTPWRAKLFEEANIEKRRRVYSLFYTFGPAPRDLASPADGQNAIPYKSTDSLTRSIPATPSSGPIIESYITTKDGVRLPYRLEGSTDPSAPLIVCSNSVLVEWGIWDSFVSSFLSKPENKKYRILRYHTRGRYSNAGTQNVTIDVLASDIIEILDALRVQKAAALIGVSLGGATVLNTALKYPNRIASFVSCDTNAKSPAGNSKAWGDRIAISEKQGSKSSSGEALVGSELAEVTVRRWFVPESYDGGALEKECERVKEMVINNSLEGFRKGVQALFQYDIEEEMKSASVKGTFVVGGGDGVLPKTMKTMADGYGAKGADLHIIDGAGHLPMVEKPKEFAQVVTTFLA